jgi:hypothetical protein
MDSLNVAGVPSSHVLRADFSDVPPLSSGQFTNLMALINGVTNITSGDITGTTTINTTGTITSGSLLRGNGLGLKNANGFYVTINPATGMTTNFSLTLPTADGTVGQVLSTNGTGQLSWSTPAGSGLSAALNSGNIFVGNGSNVATGVAMSGDATIDTTGGVSVNKIKGIAVTAAPTTAGQIFRFDGTSLVPSFI